MTGCSDRARAREESIKITSRGAEDGAASPRIVAMHKHLARGSEAITLYRRFIELARMFPDPCGRHYLFNRVAHVFRRHRGETSPDAVGGAWNQFVDRLQHLVLPTFTLALASIAGSAPWPARCG